LAERWETIKVTLEREMPGVWEIRPRGSAPVVMGLILRCLTPFRAMVTKVILKWADFREL